MESKNSMTTTAAKLTRRCPHCDGCGEIAIEGVYLSTLRILKRQGRAVNGAELARMAEVGSIAMKGRLKVLTGYGLVASRIEGRGRVYWVV